MVFRLGIVLLSLLFTNLSWGQTPKASDSVAAAASRMRQKQTYDLRYKLEQGDEIRWNVEHVVSTKVQMAGSMEDSSSRSQTVKVWKVANVDSLGNMTFVHSMDSVSMWQQVGEEEPVTFDSTKDKEIPTEYEAVAAKIGKPLAVFSITPKGKILDRKSSLRENKFGVGKVTIPMPETPVAVGHQWHVPTILQATDETGANRKLKARVLYTLVRVAGHEAYIRFKTEVLTPIKSEKIRSTIMQQMTKGYVVFNMKLGHSVLKEVEWDEKASGFEGPDSMLTYVGRMSEKLVTASADAKQSQNSLLTPMKAADVAKSVTLKTRESQPVMRK